MVEGALTTTTALIAVGVALIALAVVVAVLLLVLVRRSNRASEARLRELTAEMNNQMKEMITELSASLELAKEESRRNRYLAELAADPAALEWLRRNSPGLHARVTQRLREQLSGGDAQAA